VSRFRKVDQTKLADLRAARWTIQQMADHFGVAPRTISRNLNTTGLATPNPRAGKRMSEEWLAQAEELLEEGLSLAEIARTTGVGPCTMTRHFHGRGWDRTTSGQYANAVRKANRELSRIGVRPLRPTAPIGAAA
jgi:IS30 family transposase